jgi:hypothetical protein
MSISIGISTIGNPSSDTLGLDGAGLSGITGPALHDPNSQPSPLPPLLPGNDNSSSRSTSDPNTDTYTSTQGVEACEVDPLTPRSMTDKGSAALSTVIKTVTSALEAIHAGNSKNALDAGVTQLSQLIQSTGFRLLLQLLGSSSATADPNLASLLQGSGDDAPGAAVPAEFAAPSAADQRPAAASEDIGPAPYFRKLIGELESTYRTAPDADSAQSTSDYDASELDLFLRWLSLNGANSVIATA